MDKTRDSADTKAGSFKDKLKALQSGQSAASEGEAKSAVSAEAPASPAKTEPQPAAQHTNPASNHNDQINANGFLILKKNTSSETPSADPQPSPALPETASMDEQTTPITAEPASHEDAGLDDIEASLAQALEALTPPAETPAETPAAEEALPSAPELDEAIDAVLSDMAEASPPADEVTPGAFGAFGSFGAPAITPDDFNITDDADAHPQTPPQAPDEPVTFDDFAEAENAGPAARDDHLDHDAASRIGSSMAFAIKSIVHDEMTLSIDRIARQAVRDALRQA